MKALKKFAAYLLKESFEEYVNEYYKQVQAMDIPLMRLFAHLPENELKELAKAGVRKFLTDFKQGIALEQAEIMLKLWETDTMPGIPKAAIHPSDLVLIYAAQKLTLNKYLLKYTRNCEEVVVIIKELEEYYMTIQNNAVQLLFKIQKDVEATLEKKNKQLEEAQSIAHIGSWEWDIRNDTIIWSDELYRIYGMQPKEREITREIFLSYFEPHRIAYNINAFRRGVETGKPFQYENIIVRKNGEMRTLLVRGEPIFEPSNNLIKVIGTLQDVTELKQAELEREISKQKDEFISIASHELKTPLTSTKAYIELIQRSVAKKHETVLQEYAYKAKDSVGKLSNLISDLLDVSKIQAGKLKLNITDFNFTKLLDECIESIGHISNHHKIIIKGESNITLRGDKQRIEQVILNYLSNAVKYSPKEDTILIEISRKNGYLKLGVTDQGIGIPKEKQKRIFERFYRVEDDKNLFTGLGIGLYISAEIIKRHNGKVWVKSEEGKGATFYFSLPLK